MLRSRGTLLFKEELSKMRVPKLSAGLLCAGLAFAALPVAAEDLTIVFKTDKGNIGVPLRMTGNIAKPVFALDTQVVQENLKNRFLKPGPNSLES